MNPSPADALVLVGNPAAEHVGGHLAEAARRLDLNICFRDSTSAYRGSPLAVKLNWWLRGRLPVQLRQFSAEVFDACQTSHARALLTTGISPVDAEALSGIGESGVIRMNFLTDDPWNPAHKAAWFLRALRHYDIVFSPREANLDDLRRHGCRDVRYLPFAYSPAAHFIEEPQPAERPSFDADVFFAGGADAERLPCVSALLEAGMKVALYGGYWSRTAATRPFARGHADLRTLRKAARGARVALCLVRRANRDGHAMRSFELAAMGACILAEDTAEHRKIFGSDCGSGEPAAVFFHSIPDMVEKAMSLLRDHELRERMRAAVTRRIHAAPNTYADRLNTMLTAACGAQ